MTFTRTVDLTQFSLPGPLTSVEFSFIDPVYVWITRCNELLRNGTTLHWRPKSLHHPDTGEELHGGGIQYSKLLRCAYSSIATAGNVALFNLNWDGGSLGFGSRSSKPVHVQVMNTNSMSTDTVGLVGYIPKVDVPSGYHTQQNYVDASNHVLQTCIGYILDLIEARAKYGFICAMGGQTKRFFARLGVMSLDTPERVKYFGLRSNNACGICRKRKGRSNTRAATCHNPVDIERLYSTACAENVQGRVRRRTRKRAREKLHRHGLDYKKRCRLTKHVNTALVHVDSFGQRLFGGLCRYERMHVYFINYCGYLMELLVKSVAKSQFGLVSEVIKQCHQFRDPETGITHPRLPNLLKMTHLTAERRVRAIFYWAHALGLRADIISDATIRNAAQRAVAMLQLILIAVRGKRSYTSPELEVIFKEVGGQFFSTLEILAQHHEQKRYNKKRDDYIRNPEKHKEPVMFAKQTR